MRINKLTVTLEHDADFWQSAYQKHGAAILAYLRLRAKSVADAEDLLQETFVKAISASHSISERGKLRSFLFTIAHNLLINQMRQGKRISQVFAVDMNDSGADAFPDEKTRSPEFHTQSSIFRKKVTLLLREMKPRMRTAFELGVLGGHSYADIAQKTGWSLATVKINIYRARKFALSKLGDFIA